MLNNEQLSKDLFLKLKGHFPSIRLGDSSGMSTVKPGSAVFFDFDFTIDGEKLASVSVSIADPGTLKVIVTKDILENQSEFVKKKWFDFQKEMRNFSKQNLLSFEPSDITKSRLDTKDYQELAATSENNVKDQTMSESSLYGSSRSSYQTLENTRLIIRHSKKIEEESANSRTRNIDALYIESAGGERFRYPFVHLSGARAMQRHISNGGNPYDGFGQYIVNLSEQAYHLRKFNNIVSRKNFLENSDIAPIAGAARNKLQSIKKTLESIQKQHGYTRIKENFKGFEKKAIDQNTLESLKSKFTIQQFNEELVELFPYITDLLEGESHISEISQDAAIDLIDRARKMFPDNSHPVHKSIAGLIQAINVGSAADNRYAAEIKNHLDSIDEAKPFVKGNDPKTSDYGDADAAEEPWDDKRNPIQDLAATIESLPQIQIEKFDKVSIQAAIDGTQNQIKDLTKSVQDNPKDKKMQYALEKAQARLGLLQARLASADPQTTNVATRNAMLIDHLSKHVKDDRLSLQLARISDEYHSFKKPEMKMINDLIRAMMSKAKIVDMFAEETTFQELSSMLSTNDERVSRESEGINHLEEFEQFLDSVIENNDLTSGDDDVQSQALTKLNKLMSSHFPVGTNGINAIESLEGIIDDEELFNKIKDMAKKDADADVRPIIMSWIENNAPEIADKVSTDDAGKEPKENDDEEMEEPTNSGSPEEIKEFVKSLYDSNTGKFPKGETGVLTSVEKKYGEASVPHAAQIIEQLKVQFDETLMRLRKLAGVS